ncbi:MAG: T9SS type A sorting domain-containing protein [candidate division Zixibacteria bacterium]
MRKFLPVVSFFSLFLYCCFPVWGQEISEIDTISVSGFEGYPGDTILAPVDLVNTFDVTGFSLRILYDFSAFLPLEVVIVDRSAHFDFFGANLTEPGVIGFVATSMIPRDNVIPPGSGSIALMTILIRDEAFPGSYDFIFENVDENSYDNNLSDTNATLIVPVLADGAIDVLSQTLIGDNSSGPSEFELSQNYPNPFNMKTTISFSVKNPGHVDLEIYDILGQRVATLFSGYVEAGIRSFDWDGEISAGKEQSSGVYFYRLKTMWGESVTKRMTLLK